MGANRKRLADQMSGEERTDKKSKSSRKKKDKKRGMKNKDGQSSKSNKETSSSGGTSLETTATAEGKQMAQVLSTFSRLEQSRFEAFRKAAFHGDAISKYVAHCLIHEQHRPFSVGNTSVHEDSALRTRISGANSGPTDRDGKQKARFRHLRPNTHYNRRLELSELVAPGQAQDITVVVSTLAKEYAQRLVLAARRYTAERCGGESSAILPQDLLRAHADRQARGLDPGFFLQASKTKDARATATSLFLADPDSSQRYSLSRSVALAIQEEYDKEQAQEETDDPMKIDTDAEGDVEMKDEQTDEKDDEKQGKSDNDEVSDDDDDDDDAEEEEDPSEQAMRLFSLHVNRIIARQNGITVVTSDDEEEKKEERPVVTKSSSSSSIGNQVEDKNDTSNGNKEEETIVTVTTENKQTETSTATTQEKTKTQEESSSASNEEGKEDTSNVATEEPLESKETEEPVAMDTSGDASTSEQKASEGVEVGDGDVAMVTASDNTTKEEEKQEETPKEMPAEAIGASSPAKVQPEAPAATESTTATVEKPQAQEETISSSPTKSDDPPTDKSVSASEVASVAAEGTSSETQDTKQDRGLVTFDKS